MPFFGQPQTRQERRNSWHFLILQSKFGNDNPGAKSQGMKQLMAGGGVALIGMLLVPQLTGLFG